MTPPPYTPAGAAAALMVTRYCARQPDPAAAWVAVVRELPLWVWLEMLPAAEALATLEDGELDAVLEVAAGARLP